MRNSRRRTHSPTRSFRAVSSRSQANSEPDQDATDIAKPPLLQTLSGTHQPSIRNCSIRTYPGRRRDERPYLSSRMEGGQMAKRGAITDDGFRLSDELWGQMEPLLPA